jgi:hypothetical protein
MGKADDTVEIVYFRREKKGIELEQDSIQYLHTERKVLNKFPIHILSFQVQVFDLYHFET